MPLGFAPVLYIDGKPLSQSGSIARFVAHTFGLMGDSHLTAALCDMVFETVKEHSNALPRSEKDPEKKVIYKGQYHTFNPKISACAHRKRHSF